MIKIRLEFPQIAYYKQVSIALLKNVKIKVKNLTILTSECFVQLKKQNIVLIINTIL